MPESPDFDEVARRIIGWAVLTQTDAAADVADQLRLIWNARGEADMRTLEAPIGEIVDAIRSLDR
jgi:hypothetical protein